MIPIVSINNNAQGYCADIAGGIKSDPVLQTVRTLASKAGSFHQGADSSFSVMISNYTLKLSPFIVPNVSNSVETVYALYITPNASSKGKDT